MGVLPVVLAAVVVAASASTLPPPVHESAPSVPPSDLSVLSGLLQALGFSDICVASALNICATVPQESQLATVLKEARDLLQHVAQTVNKTLNPPRHCKDLLDAGEGQSGVRVIHPYPGQPDRRLRVYCDQTTDGGGWTIFQRRTNSTVRESFERTRREYRMGFGNIEAEFWLGLDNLHALSSTEPQELRIDLADWEGGQRHAKYGFFHVDDRESKYILSVVRYSGTAGDSLAPNNGAKFSTAEWDNDDKESENCARAYRGGWWYNLCHRANPNGYQYTGKHQSFADGINWVDWHGFHYSLRETILMTRPSY